jgi:DNA replication protein DnaC
MSDICPICEDSGLRLIIQPDGERYAQPCECRLQLQAARLLKRASIPKRYEHCSLESFDSPLNGYRQADQSLAAAHMIARSFVAG